MLSTVEKAFGVIKLFTPSEPLWGATAVAARLGLPKSGAHDLLRTLAELGVLDRQPGGQYALGALALLGALSAAHPWLNAARGAMHELARLTGEGVHLSVLRGDELLHVEDAHQGGEPFVFPPCGAPPHRVPAQFVPVQCSAMGKVLLCALPWQEVEDLIARQGLPALTVNSIATRDELQTELRRVRAQGYAYDVEEAFPGVCCVAAPLHGEGGAVLAALSVSAPAARFYEHKGAWREHLLTVTARLAQTLARPTDAPNAAAS